MSSLIIQNSEVLFEEEEWNERLKQHLKTTESVFEDLRELCEFNEVKIPSKLTYLSISNLLQQIYINRKGEGGGERLNDIAKVLDLLSSIDENEFPEKKRQFIEIAKLLYEGITNFISSHF